MQERKKIGIGESGGFGAAMAIVDANEGRGGGREDLGLIFEGGIGLNNGHGEFAGSVGLQVHVPHEAVPPGAPQTP